MLSLRFETGPREGERVLLEKRKTIFGRHLSCDCVLSHPTVSREHFSVEITAGRYLLVDNNSGNGTYANGKLVTWIEIKDGDEIKAGPFIFSVEAAPQEPTMDLNEAPAKDDTTARHRGDGQGGRAPFGKEHLLIYPGEYLAGIEHFNARRYFEAHEEWEAIWLRSTGETKLFYQMLIQSAVGLHHFEGGNYRGARGMHRAVTEKLSRLPNLIMSLDVADFSRQFERFFRELIEQGIESLPPAEGQRPLIRLLDSGGGQS